MFANKKHHRFISSTQYYCDGKQNREKKQIFFYFLKKRFTTLQQNEWEKMVDVYRMSVCVYICSPAYLFLCHWRKFNVYGKVENFKQTSLKREFSKETKNTIKTFLASYAHFCVLWNRKHLTSWKCSQRHNMKRILRIFQ